MPSILYNTTSFLVFIYLKCFPCRHHHFPQTTIFAIFAVDIPQFFELLDIFLLVSGMLLVRLHRFPFPEQGSCYTNPLSPVFVVFIVCCHIWFCLCCFPFAVFNMSEKCLLQEQPAEQLLLAFAWAASESVFQLK